MTEVDLAVSEAATLAEPPVAAVAWKTLLERSTSRRLAWSAARAVCLSVVLYFILRPENYGLTPNALDPIFYTGYSTNLDDLLRAVGQRHYFVSRWSAYLPGYLFAEVFGPIAGRLFLRLAIATAILTVISRFGRRWKWTVGQELFVGTVVITMPMFARAFFTDYTEFAVVTYGLVLLCLCLRTRQSWWSVTAIGVVGALMIVANPLALAVMAAPMAGAVIFGARSYIGRALIAVGIGVSMVATVFLGLMIFRWHYGIPNVYQPTIDFMRNPPGPDPLRSPRLDWLSRFTWLYGPPLLMAAYLLVARVRRVRLDRTEKLLLVLCAYQYAYQWYDQFGRSGDGLEISYYWSFMYPAYGLLLAVALGRASAGVRNSRLMGAGVLWLALLAFGVPDVLRFPTGLGFFALMAAALCVAVGVARRNVFAASLVVLGTVGWTQLGAPGYNPIAYHPHNMSPRYDQLFRGEPYKSEAMLDEVVWFEEQMDKVPNDAIASFVSVSGLPNLVTAAYAPHVTGRSLDGKSGPSGIVQQVMRVTPAGTPLVVAIYGEREKVGELAAALADKTSFGEPLLDEVHEGGLGYRLVVFVEDANAVSPARFPVTFRGDLLPRAVGAEFDGAAVADAIDPLGLFTYGPSVNLLPGVYRVTLAYTSADDSTQPVGRFEGVSTSSTGEQIAQLFGSNSETRFATIQFRVSSPTLWAFRTYRDLPSTVTLESIEIERIR